MTADLRLIEESYILANACAVTCWLFSACADALNITDHVLRMRCPVLWMSSISSRAANQCVLCIVVHSGLRPSEASRCYKHGESSL